MAQDFPLSLQIKKLLLYPRTLYMRWKFRGVAQSLRAMLELHSYSPAILDFIGATAYDGHILHNADINSDSIVLDVGAFTGKWADAVVELHDPVIFAFEPNPHSFARLEEKARDNSKLRPQQYGLGGRDETVEFTLNGLGSSMCDDRASNRNVEKIQVKIAAIDSAWQALSLERVDLMKINIEGAEFPLLERMIEKNMLDKVDTFLIQFHEWHPGARRRRAAIQKALSDTHRQEWNYDFVWEKWVRNT